MYDTFFVLGFCSGITANASTRSASELSRSATLGTRVPYQRKVHSRSVHTKAPTPACVHERSHRLPNVDPGITEYGSRNRIPTTRVISRRPATRVDSRSPPDKAVTRPHPRHGPSAPPSAPPAALHRSAGQDALAGGMRDGYRKQQPGQSKAGVSLLPRRDARRDGLRGSDMFAHPGGVETGAQKGSLPHPSRVAFFPHKSHSRHQTTRPRRSQAQHPTFLQGRKKEKSRERRKKEKLLSAQSRSWFFRGDPESIG